MHVQRVHYGKLIILLSVGFVLLYMVRLFFGNFPLSNIEVVEVNIEEKSPVFIEKVRDEKEVLAWTALHQCPVCLGKDLCTEFQQGFISVSLFPKRDGLLGFTEYTATLKGADPLTALVPEQWRLDQWDEWICKNSTGWPGCLVAQEVKKSQLARSDGDAPFLRGLGRSSGSSVVPLTACATRGLSSLLREGFDENNDGKLTFEEKTMMLTTVATAPGLAVLRRANKFGITSLPRYIGGCGRVSVIEGGLTPLTSYLQADFKIRADLTNQILSMVDKLLTGGWVILSWNLDWSSFAVTNTGQVVFADLNNFTPVDRKILARPEGELREVCDQECFAKFRSTVLTQTSRGQPSQGCRDALLYGDMMYQDVCRNILSSGTEGSTVYGEEGGRAGHLLDGGLEIKAGLLEGGGAELVSLVNDCVREKGRGERWRVVEELRTILENYTEGGSGAGDTEGSTTDDADLPGDDQYTDLRVKDHHVKDKSVEEAWPGDNDEETTQIDTKDDEEEDDDYDDDDDDGDDEEDEDDDDEEEDEEEDEDEEEKEEQYDDGDDKVVGEENYDDDQSK